MEYNKLPKNELIKIIEQISKILDGKNFTDENLAVNNSDSRNDLENLIGTIPFLLLNQKIFERNQDIADFAKNLGINIPSPEKKKREDMIGRIVSAIARFDNKMIAELNGAIKSLKKSDINRGKSNFFRDWENAIKEMKL